YLAGQLAVVQNLKVAGYMKIASGCYLASYVYGPESCEVEMLRRLRDEMLMSSRLLSLFVRLYYRMSPIDLRWFGNAESVKLACTNSLAPVVHALEKHYEKRQRPHPRASGGSPPLVQRRSSGGIG